jgi:hypothetical protein
MKKIVKDWVDLPTNFVKGCIIDATVSVKGKSSTKSGLKITNLNKKTVTFMEVDKARKVNIFRKVLLTDIVECTAFTQGETSSYSIKIRENVLPRKEESAWDSIGKPRYHKPFRHFSNHSKGWSSNAPQYRSTTNNPVSGFPMV